jgi:hypothetical protein
MSAECGVRNAERRPLTRDRFRTPNSALRTFPTHPIPHSSRLH